LCSRLQGAAPGGDGRPQLDRLFFLDEAVALAAGHRPCFFCRRAAAEAFRTAWGKARGGKAPLAPEMDAVLREERLDRGRKRVYANLDLSPSCQTAP
jgi:hypothetical protein